jgi:hypothetical protein
VIAQAVAEQTTATGHPLISASLRKDLFRACSFWAPEEFHACGVRIKKAEREDPLTQDRWRRMIQFGVSKLKDADARDRQTNDMRRSGDALQLSAIQVRVGDRCGASVRCIAT